MSRSISAYKQGQSLYPDLEMQNNPRHGSREVPAMSFNGHKKSDYLSLFKYFDTDHDGFIPLNEFRQRVEFGGLSAGLTHDEQAYLLDRVDYNNDRMVDFGEFCFMMSRAKSLRMQNAVFHAAKMVVPQSQREEKFSYLQQYSCIPPPLFLIAITIVEVAIYIYYVVDMKAGVSVSGPVPTHSPLIYDPYRRYQAWRYFTYMFIHIGIYHIVFNALIQLLLGIPLELVHKFWRIGIVYLAGVAAGSLAVSVCDPKVFLAGASGGVYALISAHVANLIVNWSEMEFAIFRLIFLVILIGSDFGVALYNRYGGTDEGNKVSYVAHIGGFVAGLLMGIVVLRNFKKRVWERVIWWVALVGFSLLVLLCVLWNIFYNVDEYYFKAKYD